MLYLGTTLIPTVDTFGGQTGDIAVGNGLQMSNKTVLVKVQEKNGILNGTNGLYLATTNGNPVTVDSNGYVTIKVDTTKGINIDANGKVYADVDTEKALAFDSDGVLYVKVDTTKGLKMDSANGIQINNGNGLDFADADDSGNQALKVKAGDGITVDANGVAVNPKANMGIGVDSNGVYAKLNYSTGLRVDSNGIQINAGTGLKFGEASGGMKPLEADIVTSWEATTSDSKIPSEKLVKDEIDDVREVAEGKTKQIVTNTTQMPAFGVDDNTVTVTQIKDQSGTVIWDANPSTGTPTYPSVGDIVYLTDLDYSDRWVSALNYYSYELSNIDSTNVTVTRIWLDEAIAAQLTTNRTYYVTAKNDDSWNIKNADEQVVATASIAQLRCYNTSGEVTPDTFISQQGEANFDYTRTSGTTVQSFTLSKLETVKPRVNDVQVDSTSILNTTTGAADLGTTGSLTGGTAYNKTTNPIATKAYVDGTISGAGGVDSVKVAGVEVATTDTGSSKKTARIKTWSKYDDSYSVDQFQCAALTVTALVLDAEARASLLTGNSYYLLVQNGNWFIEDSDYHTIYYTGTDSHIQPKNGSTIYGIQDFEDKQATLSFYYTETNPIATKTDVENVDYGSVKSKVMTSGHQVLSIWQGTLNEYNALTPDSTCVYIVTNLSSVE